LQHGLSATSRDDNNPRPMGLETLKPALAV